MEKNTSLTEGNVAKKILLFAAPVFLSNLFQQLYNAADSLIVGNFLGGEALAAVGSTNSLIMLLVGFVNGVSLGAGVLIARFYGAKDEDNLERAVHTTVALGLVAGAALTVVGVAFTPQILRWMGTPQNVIGSSVLYFRVYFLGSMAVVLYNMGAGILQAVGDSRSPMNYLVFSSVVNVALDLLFVAVFRWGVEGAAIATVISQALSAILSMLKLMRSRQAYRVCWRRVRFERSMLRQVVALGVPSGVQNSVISLACVFVLAPWLIAAFNSEPAVVAFGVQYARTVALFYGLLAFSHCCAGAMRGMGRPMAPLVIMLSVWCVLRIIYITVVVYFIPKIQVVFWAYPLTWGIGSVLFALWLCRLRFPPVAAMSTQSETQPCL